jgi:hypothetical protein
MCQSRRSGGSDVDGYYETPTLNRVAQLDGAVQPGPNSSAQRQGRIAQLTARVDRVGEKKEAAGGYTRKTKVPRARRTEACASTKLELGRQC